jgi:hypothetical protein
MDLVAAVVDRIPLPHGRLAHQVEAVAPLLEALRQPCAKVGDGVHLQLLDVVDAKAVDKPATRSAVFCCETRRWSGRAVAGETSPRGLAHPMPDAGVPDGAHRRHRQDAVDISA